MEKEIDDTDDDDYVDELKLKDASTNMSKSSQNGIISVDR